MEMEAYFRSLTTECSSLRDRVRHFIGSTHWLTDGEGKESILRNMITRVAPDSVKVGRGFVVDHQNVSTQVDVLFYDASHPVLYRDGDLVFISPSACRGAIEVKTSLTMSELEYASEKLATVAKAVRSVKRKDVFVGIFSYELEFSSRFRESVLDVVKDASQGDRMRVVNHVAVGKSLFVKYWKFHPDRPGGLTRIPTHRPPANCWGDYKFWHLYEMKNMAYGYFIHNALVSMASNLSTEEENVYFPEKGKETMCIHKVAFESRSRR